MSRTMVLIASLAILKLGICANASISENSTDELMPANTESISETAEAEQPARLIEDESRNSKSSPAEESAEEEKLSQEENNEAKAEKPKSKKTASSKEEDPDDKLQQEHSFMAHDDSHPGAKVDPLLYYQAGCRFIKEKKYQLALDAFNKALELNPKYHEASYRKALVYQLTNMDKYAARRYQHLLKYRPDMDEARINLAALHRKHKHYSGAEEQLRLVIQRNFHSFEAHYNLANVLVEENKPEAALKEYKICLKLKPHNPMVHNNIGVIFLQKNYPEEALQEFRKAYQLQPKNPTFQANLNTAQKHLAEKKARAITM